MANGYETIEFPTEIFEMMVNAQKQWEMFSERLGDFLLAQDDSFLKKMRASRKSHLRGKLGDWKNLKAELNV